MRRSLLSFAFAAIVCGALFAGACGSDAASAPDGGGAGGAGGAGGLPDTSVHSYAADDPGIVYMGRIDAGNPKQPRFALGATTITARFMGTGASALIKDEYRYGMFQNYYDVSIDGMPPTKLTETGDASMFEYPLATGLDYGEHTVTILKRTEPNVGLGFFAGLNVSGTILPAPDPKPRKLEFVGDSITAGAGVEANGSTDPACNLDSGYALALMDAGKAYSADTARDLNAEYHALGVSGIGLVRNYTSDPKNDLRPMPLVYDLLLPELTDTTAANLWDTTKWVPDAIVVVLGTNDFSQGDNPPLTAPGTPADARPLMDVATFATAYIAFIDTLRGYYPAAHIFAMSSPMLVDGYPATGLYTSKTDLENALAMVEDHYTTAGVTTVHKVLVAKVTGSGCGTHPGVAEHQAVATTLEAAIKSALTW